MKTKILYLKNRVFQVLIDDDTNRLTLIDEKGEVSKDAGSIIGSLGGIQATLLRCVDTDEPFTDIIKRRDSQKAIINKQRDDDVAYMQSHDCRCDVDSKKFAVVDGRYYTHRPYNGWVRSSKEVYENAVKASEQRKITYKKYSEELNVIQEQHGLIPVSIDNLRKLIFCLSCENWESWDLPKLSMEYEALPYDCEGRMTVGVILEEPIDIDGQKIKKFTHNAPSGHLKNFYRL